MVIVAIAGFFGAATFGALHGYAVLKTDYGWFGEKSVQTATADQPPAVAPAPPPPKESHCVGIEGNVDGVVFWNSKIRGCDRGVEIRNGPKNIYFYGSPVTGPMDKPNAPDDK